MTKETLIETKSGRIKGLIKTSVLGDQYFSFQKIPYGKTPIGALRFRAPVPVEPWETVLDATNEGPVPFYARAHFEGLVQSEDCLHLNVYSKNVHSDSKLPVIVFIYGGTFNSGSSTTKLYGPDYFMQKDVVLVTFNYRVGPLGFLHFNDSSLQVAGNAGLKDQLLVLKWVQENIERFGGDKNNVTLAGHSAGSGSVNYHLISESSKHLFHRAILMSGSALSTWGVMPPNDLNLDLAKGTGWDGIGDERGVYDHLMSVDAETLMQTSRKLLTQEYLLKGFIIPFGPVVETYKSESTFIDEHPVKLAQKAWSKDIDIIVGYTTNEGLFQVANDKFMLYKMMPSYQLVMPSDARNVKSEDVLSEHGKSIRKLYNDFSELSPGNMQPFFDFVSDMSILHGVHRKILSRLSHRGPSSGKTFIYRFCYDFPTRNHHKRVYGAAKHPGACHGDDLSYIFMNGFGPVPKEGTDERNAVQKMVDLYTGFAEKGCEKLKHLGWNEVQLEHLPYEYECMQIDEEWKMTKLNEIDRLKVWDSVYAKEELY